MARAFSLTINRDDVLSTLTTKFPSSATEDDYLDILSEIYKDFNAIVSVDTVSGADANRTAGTYSSVAFTTSGSGTGATFNITVDANGAATVTVVKGGTGYAVDETITVPNSSLGSGSGVTEVVVSDTGSDSTYAATYTVAQGKEFDTANDQFINSASQNYFRSATSGTANIIAWDSTESAWYIIPSVDQSDFSYTADSEIEVSAWGSSATNPNGASSVYGTATPTTEDAADLTFDVAVIATNPSKDFNFNRNTNRTSTHRTLTAQFGDGYEQRVLNGINTKNETLTALFSNRAWQDIETISAFLDAKAARSFDIVLQRETLKVICENYNITYTQPNVHTLSANLKRVYEP